MRLLALIASFVVLLAATPVVAQEHYAPPILEDPPKPPLHRSAVTFTAGLVKAAPSQEDAILSEEGYHAVRGTIRADFLERIDGSRLAVGGFAAYQFRSAGAPHGGPDLVESVWMTGPGAAFFIAETRRVHIALRGWTGLASTSVGFTTTAPNQWAPVFDLDLSLTAHGAAFGFAGAIGYRTIPTPSPGTLGGHNDFGGFHLDLGIYFGV